MATRLATRAENVLRLAAIDCSSPMSAKIDRNGVNWLPASTGISRPACAMSARRPTAFSATVLPPVFGPEITSARTGGVTSRSVAVTTAGPEAGTPDANSSDSDERTPGVISLTAGISSGCRAPRNSTRPSVAIPGARSVDSSSQLRLRVELVEIGGRVPRRRELLAPAPKGVGEREQDAPDFLALALRERDDLIVQLDGRERLEVQARAAGRRAMDDAGDGVTMLRRAGRPRTGRCDR